MKRIEVALGYTTSIKCIGIHNKFIHFKNFSHIPLAVLLLIFHFIIYYILEFKYSANVPFTVPLKVFAVALSVFIAEAVKVCRQFMPT